MADERRTRDVRSELKLRETLAESGAGPKAAGQGDAALDPAKASAEQAAAKATPRGA